MSRIAVAMSGGVDSSVAAWLLTQEGHQAGLCPRVSRYGALLSRGNLPGSDYLLPPGYSSLYAEPCAAI